MKRLVPAAIAALLACAPAEAQTFFSGLPNAPSVSAGDWTLLRKASPSPGPGVGTVYQATIAQILSPLKATGDCSGTVSAVTLVLSCPGVANALPLAGGAMTGPITGASGLLPLAGGTMTGALMLSGDPASSFQAATKAYVDSGVGTGLPLAGGTMTGPILGASGLLPLAGGTLTGPALSTASLASGAAALDLRGVTQTAGANSVWLKDGGEIAFDTAGTNTLSWDGSEINASGVLGAQSLTTPFRYNTWTGKTYGPATSPIYSTVGVQGTSGAPAFSDIYHFAINDFMASPNGLLNGYGFTLNMGTNSTNYRSAVTGLLNLYQQTGNKAAGIDAIQVGGTFTAQASANDGGTAPTQAGAFTSITAMNASSILYPGATNYAGAAGMEVDTAVAAGASAWRKRGLLIVQTSIDRVQGAVDTGLVIADQPGAPGWRDAISIGDVLSEWSVSAGGNIMVSRIGQSGAASTAGNGVNFLESSFTGYAFRSPGFGVDGSGNVFVGPSAIQNDTSGITINASGALGASVIASGGANYVVGDVFYDGYGGVYTVQAVSSGAITSFATVRQPTTRASALPSNPVPTTTNAKSIGAGGTLTITWTAKPLLTLNPSGDTIAGTGAALSNAATSGFFHLPFTNGTPTGTPANTSVPCEWNDTSKTMNCYSPGASGWYHFTFTAGAA